MKCPKCGKEIDDGSLFCPNCAEILEGPIKYCRECGAKLEEGQERCPNCGAKIYSIKEQIAISAAEDDDLEIHDIKNNDEEYHDDHKTMAKEVNSVVDQYCQSKKLSTIQLQSMSVAAIILICMAIFTTVSLRRSMTERSDLARSTHTTRNVLDKDNDTLPPDNGKVTNYVTTKGTSYAYMSDEWNVYIARVISDSMIKIEHWDKGLESTKKMSYSEDIGTFDINDNQYGFSWIDDTHTAFNFTFRDKYGHSNVKKYNSHPFSININDKDTFKGSDYDKNISSYLYKCDDWHEYRAIPLAKDFIKIECWARASTTDDFCFGWDWCVINDKDNDMSFQWTDNDHTSFTIFAKDKQNSHYWRDKNSVLFEIENPDAKYKTVNDYLNSLKPSVSPSPTPVATATPIPTPASTPTPDTSKATSASMPVMAGTNVEDITNAVESYGLSMPTIDEDLADDQELRSLSTADGGIIMDLVFSLTSNEILTAEILTNSSVSTSEQQDFIRNIVGMLYPSASKDSVSQWVNANVGKTAETTIDGFDYSLSYESGNAVFESGNKTWQNWVNSAGIKN